ncbi:TPA: hypothetical protein ACTUXY_003064 [Legionella pneumophila]
MPKKDFVEEHDKIVTLTVDIPYELKDRLKFYSYKDKKPIKDIVREALEDYLEKN